VVLVLLEIDIHLVSHRFLGAFSPRVLEYSFGLRQLVFEFLTVEFFLLTDKFVKFILVVVDLLQQFLNILGVLMRLLLAEEPIA
jgi:hypothetical protein